MYTFTDSKNTSYPFVNEHSMPRLLRGLGANGRLTGFQYLVYIVETILQNPDEHFFLTKSIYPDTAKHFNVNPASIEHAIRTVIRICWEYPDHNCLDYVAGRHLTHIPTNSEFIDMLVAYMQYIEENK